MNNIENSNNCNEVDSKDGRNNLIENVFYCLDFISLFVVTMVLVHTFFYRSMHVEGESMQDTFQPKESVGVSNFLYEPKVSDIVIINTFNLLGRTIIKRIIAKEGDTIRIDGGEVYVNDVKLNEPYVKKGNKTLRKNFPDKLVVVPKGCFFAMGDHRMGSSDSRDFGFFRYDQIVGRVFCRFWPFSDFKFFY